MTKLIVKSPDPDALGYTGKTYRIAKAYQALTDEPNNATAFVAIIDVLAELSTTDDGEPVREVLESLTRDQLSEAMAQLRASSVPTMSDDS